MSSGRSRTIDSRRLSSAETLFMAPQTQNRAAQAEARAALPLPAIAERIKRSCREGLQCLGSLFLPWLCWRLLFLEPVDQLRLARLAFAELQREIRQRFGVLGD